MNKLQFIILQNSLNPNLQYEGIWRLDFGERVRT